DVTAKEGSTNDLVVLEATNQNTLLTDTIIEVDALDDQRVVALQYRAGGADVPGGLIANNRIRVTGGTGSGAVLDNCRGALWTGNVVEVDATSGLASGFASECNWLHRMRPL